MKKPAISLFVFLTLTFAFPSCAGAAPAQDTAPETGIAAETGMAADFSEAEGKEWVLSEIMRFREIVKIDRNALEAIGMGGAFTVSFQDGRVSGMGAPNRYFGPFSAGPDMTLNIGNLASTLMAAISEPEALKEHEYFAYLSRTVRWDLHEGRLELYSANNDETVAVLVYELQSR